MVQGLDLIWPLRQQQRRLQLALHFGIVALHLRQLGRVGWVQLWLVEWLWLGEQRSWHLGWREVLREQFGCSWVQWVRSWEHQMAGLAAPMFVLEQRVWQQHLASILPEVVGVVWVRLQELVW